MLVKLGTTIHLNLQLEDGAVDKFPQAVLKDGAGATLTTVDLAHCANGLYQDDSQVMPNTDEVTATYIVYEDAGHTIISTLYGESLDVYTLDRTLSIVENIEANLQALVSGNLPGDSLVGFIEDGGELVGDLEDNNDMLVGSLDDDEELVGLLEDEDMLIGLIEEPDNLLEGLIEC